LGESESAPLAERTRIVTIATSRRTRGRPRATRRFACGSRTL